MGHSGSRLITRSAPKDALANLTTTLDDLTRWEDKASQLKDCIEGVKEPIAANGKHYSPCSTLETSKD